MLAHGGNLNDAVQFYGRPRSEWLDLSTGINPRAYPAPLLPDDVWQRLPEPARELMVTAGQCYDAQYLLPVAGSQAAIQALPRLRAHCRVVIAAPSYAEHAHAWRRAGHEVMEVPYARLADVIEHCEVLVLCNPNNPTGALIAPELLLDWSAQLARRGGWLVVDEAFVDATPDLSVACFAHRPGLIVLRSVGKFYGLAGLRLGFVLAHPALLDQLAELLGPWTVSRAAQLIAQDALADQAWQTSTRGFLTASGKLLHLTLASHGIQASGTGLFQWWPEPHAEAFHEHMAQQGIWVRLFADKARGIRIGLPLHDAEWQRLEAALESWSSPESHA